MVEFPLTNLLTKFEDAENLLQLEEGSREFLEAIGKVLEDLREICTKLELGKELIRQINLALAFYRGEADEQRLRVLLELLIPGVKVALVDRLFFMLTPEDGEWFSMPVSDRLSKRFRPALKYDLDEARKCFALERYTASVFHSMRVAESLLRELVRCVPLDLAMPNEQQELSYDDMNQLLRKLKGRLEVVRNQKKSDEREGQIQLLSNAGDQCLFFMAVRNEISHARGVASRLRALDILRRVESFAERLAAELLEPSE